jgi:hypothetical protein
MQKLILRLFLSTLLAIPAFALNQMTRVGYYDGEDADNFFGKSTTMGDFDGDLKYEFAIGASGWNENTGKVYLYQYDQDWPVEPFLTVQGDTVQVSYGMYIANLGDINADGLSDLGIPEHANIWTDERLDIYFGSDPIDTISDWTMHTLHSTAFYGEFIDSCGDVNGDGWTDIMMMNSYYTDYDYQIEIYHGGEVLDSFPDWSAWGPCRLSSLGDVNGDGYSDILAINGSYWARIYFGGDPMDTIPDLSFEENIGASIWGGGIGDVNCDGYPDFVIQQWMPDSSRSYGYLYLGGDDVDDIPDYILENHFGELWGLDDYVTHGDYNGDGYDDFAVHTGNPSIGDLIYIYLGSHWFNPVPDAMVTEYSNIYDYGAMLSSGDVNGDGRDEILVTAPNYPWFMQGRVYLYTGPEEWIDYGAGVEPGELPHHPGWFKLNQNYPNPFNASTTIHFEIGKPSTVTLTIYDLKGNTIRELISGQKMLPGGFNVSWAGRNEQNQPVSSGIYLLEFRVDQYLEIRKMVMLR